MLFPNRFLILPPPSLQFIALSDLAVNRILLIQLLLSYVLHRADCSKVHLLAACPQSPLFGADLGSRFTFHCDLSLPTKTFGETTMTGGSHSLQSVRSAHSPQGILWKKDNQVISQSETSWHFYRRQMTLLNLALKREDAGNYTCQPFIVDADNEHSALPKSIMCARLEIQTPPGRLVNVSVRPSQVFASVRWAVADGGDGGAPITHFTLVYQQVLQAHFGKLDADPDPRNAKRNDPPTENTIISKSFERLKDAHGKQYPSELQNDTLHDDQHQRSTHLPLHISPTARQYFVYHLRPNALYQFKMWATNRLGSGEHSLLYISTNTVQKKSHNRPNSNATSNQAHNEDAKAGEHLLQTGAPTNDRTHSGPAITVVGFADDDLSATAWITAVTMVFTTVVILALLSCVLIYKEASNDDTAYIPMYQSDPEPANGRQVPVSFYSSAAAMQILLDPARSFRRFYRLQRTEVLEERTVLLAEVNTGNCNDNLQLPPTRLNNNSVLRPLCEQDKEQLADDENRQRRQPQQH
ncbi:uncharacterized protein LOC111263883 isoform X1 [Varroa jacobsoni]|uniref:uncharacterized protein LOC111263883 isoform X1 n=2 Tax=Varroa jacobsoni TaxID=62625 RepID=UPI000BF89685|nr:uncharacterized protein LOC111263883 isoform X1 [Varroa jacobsoni]